MLVKETDGLAEEVRIHEYCRDHGLNYHGSAGYASAVNGLTKKRYGACGAAAGLPEGNGAASELLISKTVGGADASCYNDNDIAARNSRILEGLKKRLALWQV